MRAKFNIKFLLSQVTEKAAKERKVFGGTYKAFFYFAGIPDYFSIYGNGLVQAIGQDESHTYYKSWANSSFSSFPPEEILAQLGSQISKIVIEGCGNNYTKIFLSFNNFLAWIDLTPDGMELVQTVEAALQVPVSGDNETAAHKEKAEAKVEEKEGKDEKKS